MAATLTFNEERHEYRLAGVSLPSVTQILTEMSVGPIYPPGPYKKRGSQVHKATQLVDVGVIGEYNLGSEIEGYVRSYERLFENYPFVWTHTEHATYDPVLMVAGTVDRVGAVWDKPCVVDFKTGKPGRETGLQLAAYTLMEFPKDYEQIVRYKVELDKDGEPPRVVRYEDAFDFEAWRGIVAFFKWRQRKAA